MKLENLANKFTYKRMAWGMIFVFAVSLLPILYCSFFDYATGDDLWEGAAAYRVLAENGTINEFFTAIRNWFIVDYYSWEGNWASIVLWCLQPSIWGEKVYCITPWISIISCCVGISYFTFYFLKKYFNADNWFSTIVSVLLCFFFIQYMPYIRGGIFWYTGMINYIVPFNLMLVAFVWIDKFVDEKKVRYCVGVALVYSYLGGAGYQPLVVAFEILFIYIAACLFLGERQKRKNSLWLLIPLLLLLVGTYISISSPGNAVRGGENYVFSIRRVCSTILLCLKSGFLGAFQWMLTVRPLFLAMPILFVTTWELVDLKNIRIKLKYPFIVVLFLYLISCSIYAPEIYSMSDVSGGVPDVVYLLYLLCYFAGIIYLTCYVKDLLTRKKCKLNSTIFKKMRVLVAVGTVLFSVFAGKFLIGNMAAYVCVDFIKSGQLADFEYQMQERLAILHDPTIKNVILPEMNDQQGPFMHMAIVADPEAYTNRATARFYGKESVVAIPRTEYYELYGYPEEME